jgi:hypothetical protein
MKTDGDEYKEGSSQKGDSVGGEDQGRRRISILDRLIEMQTERLGNRNNSDVWDICNHRASSNVRGDEACMTNPKARVKSLIRRRVP